MTEPNPSPPAGGDAPKPMPFAIMRNSHEALRASINLQEQKLLAGDLSAFASEWESFQRALAVHMAMEDRFMFALLDEVSSGAITSAKLPAEHVEDQRLAEAVGAALAAKDSAALATAFSAWKADHLHHLSHEEEVMMPLTMKTAPTPEGRARIVHERLLTPSESLPSFDWYIGWVVRLLSEHGSASQSPAVAVRVFAWGLQHACSPAQWARLGAVVEANTAPALWSQMAAKFELDGPGKIA